MQALKPTEEAQILKKTPQHITLKSNAKRRLQKPGTEEECLGQMTTSKDNNHLPSNPIEQSKEIKWLLGFCMGFFIGYLTNKVI